MWHLDAERGECSPQPVSASGKHTREYSCLAFSADLEFLFAGTTSGDVAVVLMKNRVVQDFVSVCKAGVMSIVCVPGQDVQLLCGGGDGSATLVCGPEVAQLQEEKQVMLDGPLTSMSLGPNLQEAMAVSGVGVCFRLRCADLSVKVHSQASAGALYDVAYPAGISDLFLTCSSDTYVTLWDANDYSARVRCPTRSRSHPISVAASEDVMVSGCTGGRLQCFDMKRGDLLWHIDNAHKGGVTSVKLAPNIRFVMSAGNEGELRMWEFKTRKMWAHLKEHSARVNEVQLFPSGMYALSVGRDRCLYTWDLQQEKRLTAHRERHGSLNSLALASNQTFVVTAGQEKTLTYWDLRKGDPVRTVSVDEEVLSLSMSHDDRYLATGGTGQVVKVWDIDSAEVVSVGTGHSREIKRLSFSPDGKQVVSVGLDHAALVWNFYTY